MHEPDPAPGGTPGSAQQPRPARGDVGRGHLPARRTGCSSPPERGDRYDIVLRGQPATIERIYLDYEDGLHLAVTVDSDPGQELMRETGRYYFFGAGEVEQLARAELRD